MAIASSVPVPEIYLLKEELGINAFVAGYSPSDAVLAVTRGCLEHLSRDELQGVIGHEFSHLLNGDMRLNIRLLGWQHGLLMVGQLGLKMTERVSGGKGESRPPSKMALVGFALCVLGFIGQFIALLIQAAISRSREYLADASAVQFTRQSEGIAGALKKIAALPVGSQLYASNRTAITHMTFNDSGASWFDTHPPLLERIRRLDPHFSESELEALAESLSKRRVVSMMARTTGVPSYPSADQLIQPPAPASSLMLEPKDVISYIGAADQLALDEAVVLLATLPEALREGICSIEAAKAIALWLSLSEDPLLRLKHAQKLNDHLSVNEQALLERFKPLLQSLHPLHRLPVAQLAFPWLRRLPQPELKRFLSLLRSLVQDEAETSIYAYCLGRLLQLQVVDALDPARAYAHQRLKLLQCEQSITDLFSILAQHIHSNEQEAKVAFLEATAIVLPGHALKYRFCPSWRSVLDRALLQLNQLIPTGKRVIIDGVVAAISLDGRLAAQESELLIVICAALRCPLPLFPGAPRLGDQAFEKTEALAHGAQLL